MNRKLESWLIFILLVLVILSACSWLFLFGRAILLIVRAFLSLL